MRETLSAITCKACGGDSKKMISLIMRMLFYVLPKDKFSDQEIAEFGSIVFTINNGETINYEAPFPKYRFLQYLSLKQNYLFHGSNNHSIDLFEPREQTLFNNKLTKAVFATSDPVWSMFFAVFDRSKLVGSFRNGCLVYKDMKYHYYSLNKFTSMNYPWTEGMVYILPKDIFKRSDTGKIHFDEWISHDYVRPIGKLVVGIDDFYYKDKVAIHEPRESVLRTWLLYKRRTLKAESRMASNSR